jgi:hypothetical protein
VLRVADINGDSFADVVNFRTDGNVYVAFACGPRAAGGAHLPVPGCSAFDMIGTPTLWFSNFWQPNVDPSDSVMVGDFNGDGFADILHRTTGGNVFVALTEAQACATGGDCPDSVCLRPSETRHEGSMHCRMGYGQRPTTQTQWFTSTSVNMVGDFNGDDRDDLAHVVSDGTLRVALSNEIGGRSCTSSSQCPNSSCSCGFCVANFETRVQWGTVTSGCASPAQCRVGDHDRDGRDDVFKFYRDTAGTRINDVWTFRSATP